MFQRDPGFVLPRGRLWVRFFRVHFFIRITAGPPHCTQAACRHGAFQGTPPFETDLPELWFTASLSLVKSVRREYNVQER